MGQAFRAIYARRIDCEESVGRASCGLSLVLRAGFEPATSGDITRKISSFLFYHRASPQQCVEILFNIETNISKMDDLKCQVTKRRSCSE